MRPDRERFPPLAERFAHLRYREGQIKAKPAAPTAAERKAAALEQVRLAGAAAAEAALAKPASTPAKPAAPEVTTVEGLTFEQSERIRIRGNLTAEERGWVQGWEDYLYGFGTDDNGLYINGTTEPPDFDPGPDLEGEEEEQPSTVSPSDPKPDDPETSEELTDELRALL